MSIAMGNDPSHPSVARRLDLAANAMRDAATPLLAVLDRSQLRAVESDGDRSDEPGDDSTAPMGDGGDQARAGT